MVGSHAGGPGPRATTQAPEETPAAPAPTPFGGVGREGLWLAALCVGVVLAVSLEVAPPRRFYWSGHEAVYGAILRGEVSPSDEVGWATTAPMRGLAMVLRWVFGGWAEALWLWLQRAAGAASPLLIALALRRRVPQGGFSLVVATSTAILLLSPAFLRWSAAGYGLSIAWALALLCLVATAEGWSVSALMLGALALWMRPETVSITLLAVVLAAGGGGHGGVRPGASALSWRSVGIVVGVLCALAGILGRLGPVLGGLAPLALIRANLWLLAGAWPEGRLPVFIVALVLWRALFSTHRSALDRPTAVGDSGEAVRRLSLGLLLVVPVAAVAPLLLVDAGARHFVPFDLLIAFAAAFVVAQCAAAFSPAWQRLLAVLLPLAASTFVLMPRADGSHLGDRYGGDHRTLRAGLPPWPAAALADAAPSEERVVLVPGGVLPGSVDLDDALATTERTLAASCVVLAVGSAWAYTGDARGERVDRLVLRHGLVPLARIDDAPADGPWVVFGPRPGRSVVGSSVPPPLCYPPRPDASPSLSLPLGRRRRAD